MYIYIYIYIYTYMTPLCDLREAVRAVNGEREDRSAPLHLPSIDKFWKVNSSTNLSTQ